jgi:hypothetical protein
MVEKLEQRRRLLMINGLRRDDAIEQAANEVVADWGLNIKSATLISWWANPKRLRHR